MKNVAVKNVLDIVDYIASKGIHSPTKISKLLYFSYSWYLIKYNDTYNNKMNVLFSDDILAYANGCVVKQALDYMNANKNYFDSSNYDKSPNTIKIEDEKAKELIDLVIKVYGRYSSYQLSNMNKNEYPWYDTYTNENKKNKKISTESIYRFYQYLNDKYDDKIKNEEEYKVYRRRLRYYNR